MQLLKITGKTDDPATRYQAASHRMYFEEGHSKGAQIVGVKTQSLIDPKLIVFFVGLIVPLFFGVSGLARASTLRIQGS